MNSGEVCSNNTGILIDSKKKKYALVFEKSSKTNFFLQKIENFGQKIEKSRNFLKNLKLFIFFEIFSENVLKTLLRGRETTRKKYRIVFEKC